MKSKRNKAFLALAALFLIGIVLIIIGFSNRNGTLTLIGGILCGCSPNLCIVIFILSVIFGGKSSRSEPSSAAQKSEECPTEPDSKTQEVSDAADAAAADAADDDDDEDYDKEYDEVFERECDFVDWLTDHDLIDIQDEYLDKAYDIWDLYTGKDGDDTLDRLTALLDEYEARVGYTRQTDPHIGSNIDSHIDGKVGSKIFVESKSVGSRRKSFKLGCLFPIFFVVMFFVTIVFFIRGMFTAGLISFFTIFGGTIIFIGSLFIRERIIFSTKIDPDKYEFRNGVVENCYCSGTTRVNSRTYKTFVLTLNVDGKEVTAYARKGHMEGEIVRLAVRKDKPLAKLVDSDGKAIYCYKYDYYKSLDSSKSATVGMIDTAEKPSQPTESRRSDAGATETQQGKPNKAEPLRSEVIMPTRAVEDLCEKEDKLTDALESRGLFAVSDEYRKEAETHWNEYQGGNGDSDDFILKWIDKLIDAYTAMYIDGKMSAPTLSAATAEDKTSKDEEKTPSVLPTADAVHTDAADKKHEPEAAEKQESEAAEKIEPEAAEKIEPDRDYRSFDNAEDTSVSREQTLSPEPVEPSDAEIDAAPTAETKDLAAKDDKAFEHKTGAGAGRRIGYRPAKKKK